MSYRDESESDEHASQRPARSAQAARPAWDAATYGRPDDTRWARPAPSTSRDLPVSPDRQYGDGLSAYPLYSEPDPAAADSGYDASPASTASSDPATSYDPSPSYDTSSYDSSSSYDASTSYDSSSSYDASTSYDTSSYRAATSFGTSTDYDVADPVSSRYPGGDADRYPAGAPDPYSVPGPDQFLAGDNDGYHPLASYPSEDSFRSEYGFEFDRSPEFDSSAEFDRSAEFGSSTEFDATASGADDDPDQRYPGGAADTSDEPQPAKPSRAGRNLPAAIGVGLALGALVLSSLFVWRPAFLILIAVAVGVGIWELVRAIRTSGTNPPLIPLVAGGAVMAVLAWFGHADALTFGLVVTVLAVMVWRLADGTAGYGRDVSAGAFVSVYVGLLAGFAAMLAQPPDGGLRVVAMLGSVVLSDTGGYIAGVLFGRHPMAPSVSPKKSWEGLAGSLLATALGGALMLFFMFDVALWWGALFGVAVSAASVLGDLSESLIKRDLGVKDMGTLLPGHGGLMDRLDSILFAAPTAYGLLVLLAPPV